MHRKKWETLSGEEHKIEMQTTNTVADVKDAYEAKVSGLSRWAQAGSHTTFEYR